MCLFSLAVFNREALLTLLEHFSLTFQPSGQLRPAGSFQEDAKQRPAWNVKQERPWPCQIWFYFTPTKCLYIKIAIRETKNAVENNTERSFEIRFRSCLDYKRRQLFLKSATSLGNWNEFPQFPRSV